MKEPMKKKKKEDMDELHKSAKMDAISGLRQTAMDAMKGKLEGLKKVTVASDSKEGIKEGLEKAKEIVEKGPNGEAPEAEEESLEEESEDGEESKEQLLSELEQKMKELEELKQKLMMKA